MSEGSTDDAGGPRLLQQDPSFGSMMCWEAEPEYRHTRMKAETPVFTDPDPGNSIMPDDEGRYPSWVYNMHPNMEKAWFNPEWIPLDGLLQDKIEGELDVDNRPEFDRLLYDLSAGLDHQVEEARRRAEQMPLTINAAAYENRYSFRPIFVHDDGPYPPVPRPQSNKIVSSRTGSKKARTASPKKSNRDATGKASAVPAGSMQSMALGAAMKRKASNSHAHRGSVSEDRSTRRSSEASRRGEYHRRELSPVREQDYSNPESATKHHSRKHGHTHQIVYSPLRSNRSKTKLDNKLKPPSIFSSRAKILAFREAHAAATERNYKEAFKAGDETVKRVHDRSAGIAADKSPGKAAHGSRGKHDMQADSEVEDDSEREAVRMFVRDRRARKKLAKERERTAACQAEDNRTDRHARSHERSTRRDDRHHRQDHRGSARHGYDGHRSGESYSDAELFTRHSGQHASSRVPPHAAAPPSTIQRRETAPPVYTETSSKPLDSIPSWQRQSPDRESKHAVHDRRTRRRHNSMPTSDQGRQAEKSSSTRSSHRRAHSGIREGHGDRNSSAAASGSRGGDNYSPPPVPQSWPFVYQPPNEHEQAGRRRTKEYGLSTLWLKIARMHV